MGTDTNTTYLLQAQQVSGSNVSPNLFLNASSGTDDTVRLVGGTNMTITRNDNGQITFVAQNDNTQLSAEQVQDIVGAMFSGNTETRISATYQDSDGTIDLVVDDQSSDDNTTYDLEVVNHGSSTGSGSGNDAIIRLNPSSGSDDDVRIIAGDNVVLGHNTSNDTITINTSATLSGTIAQANTIKISTATGNEYKNITFVDRDVTNNSYDTLKIDSQDDQLAYNPSENRLKTTGIQLSKIYTNGGSAGNSGQVLTSGGTGNFSWTDADSVGVDNYANSLSFSGGTLTLGRTGSLSNLTTTIPLSGITGDFTDLDDTPNNYSGDANKVVVVNSSANGLTFQTASTVGTDTNYYLSGLSFNTGNGVLTATVTGASNQTVDLDGRYAQSSEGVPLGTIVIWYGSISNIPNGWSLCNGQTVNSYQTPDLRNRFVVGSWSDTANSAWPNTSPGDTGGSADATLVAHSHTINNHTHQINNHTHTFSGTVTDTNLSHSHTYSSANHPTGSGPEQNQTGSPEDRTTFNVGKTTGSALGNHAHSYSGTTGNPSNRGTGNPSDRGTDSQGSSANDANLPPYYSLAYIMKTS